MAYGGPQNWELLCPVCKSLIEINNNDDLQASLDYHYLNVHPTLRDISQSTNNGLAFNDKYTDEKIINQPREECTNYLICPLCDCVVEIIQNSINHCFMEHFENYHELQLISAAVHSPVQARRGQSTKVLKHVESSNDQFNDVQNTNPEYLTNNLFDLPSDLKKHRGHIVFNNNFFMCHICGETLNTQRIVEEHLKTKRHEDNVIIWLKNKLSKHLHPAMEFVSFCDFNLCCKLCRCKIDLNSNNPHETLLNIISHNVDVKHSQTKSIEDFRKIHIGDKILESLTEKNTLINEHREFIETEIEPRFKCKLCDKVIHFNKSDSELEQNFLTHINSVLHIKNSQAMSVLQFFKGMNVDKNGRHCFSVLNGVISCTQCKCTIVANVEHLLEHCQGNLNLEASHVSENKNIQHTPVSPTKPFLNNKSNSPLENSLGNKPTNRNLFDAKSSPSQTFRPKMFCKTKDVKKADVKEILQPLQKQFGNITCIADSDDGKLTCLICNCSIQPSTHCVKMHMLGKFHKNKTQCQIKELNTLNLQEEVNQDTSLYNKETSREPYQDLIQHLFQSLPTRFQSEKDFCTVNLMDGSINCTLCNCTIDPLFIQVHLQEETHIHQKQLRRA